MKSLSLFISPYNQVSHFFQQRACVFFSLLSGADVLAEAVVAPDSSG